MVLWLRAPTPGSLRLASALPTSAWVTPSLIRRCLNRSAKASEHSVILSYIGRMLKGYNRCSLRCCQYNSPVPSSLGSVSTSLRGIGGPWGWWWGWWARWWGDIMPAHHMVTWSGVTCELTWGGLVHRAHGRVEAGVGGAHTVLHRAR